VDTRTDLIAELFSVVGRFRRQLRRSTGRGFDAAGLTQSQGEMLRLVGRQPGISVREAATELGLVPNTASTLVSKLSADGLWAMRDADILLRTPLVNFYATLSDDQKAQLGSTAAELPCSLAANDLPVGAIEQSVRPTEAQRASLEMMKGFSSEMSGYLASSCPNEAPADPVGRLDAAGNRVSALLYAVMLFDQALNGFYSGLSDDQKKRFDGVRR